MLVVDISVLIINWNTKDMLQRCLNCVFASNTEGLSMEVVVVDNGSTDESREMIETQFPQTKLIANRENLGFAMANNQAHRESLGRNILLLNPDTEFPPELIAGLARFLDSKPNVGAVCPRYLLPDGRFSTRGHYCRLPTLMSSLLYYTVARPFGKKTPWVKSYLMEDELFNSPMPIEQPAAACLMVRRGSFDGDLLDNRFPLFFNDVDLCCRIWKKGYQIMYLPWYTLIHHQGTSVKRLRPLDSRRETYIGLIGYFEKHRPRYQLRILQLGLLLSLAVENLWILCSRLLQMDSSRPLFSFRWIWLVLVQRKSKFPL